MTREMRVAAVQFPVSDRVEMNLSSIVSAVGELRDADLIVTPEGSLSGYTDDGLLAARVDMAEVDAALESLASVLRGSSTRVWVGTYRSTARRISNSAVCVTRDGVVASYAKVNLTTNERGRLDPGSTLATAGPDDSHVGVQICRELRFADQWTTLASAGVEVFAHLNNSLGTSDEDTGSWTSMLVARAMENQRFVVSANAAGPFQRSPSIILDPKGRVLAEVSSAGAAIATADVDLSQTSSFYLDQRRTDLRLSK